MVNTLDVNNVGKIYNNTYIFQNLNYKFTAGRYAIFGANGCGKSTFLKMIAGIIKPDQGLIRFNGIPTIYNNTEFKRLTSYVPDTPIVYPFMRGKEFIQFVKKIKTFNNEKIIVELLSLLNLTDHLELPFHKMSLGTQKNS